MTCGGLNSKKGLDPRKAAAQPVRSKRIQKDHFGDKKKILDKSIRATQQATASMGAFAPNGTPIQTGKTRVKREGAHFASVKKESQRNHDVLKRILTA